MASERISVWCSVPSTLVRLVERGELRSHDTSALRWVLFAGERFPIKHLHALMQLVSHPRYCNMYGTTETHIAAYHRITAPASELSMQPLPIGAGCSHVELAIVGKDGRAVPHGEAGELAIRGPSLMEGYWGMPERTASVVRPVLDRRSADDGAAATGSPRLTERVPTFYHTGDIARLNANGDIELFGRGDRRVKLRGNLVDLDEIEKVLQSHAQVKEATALLVGGDADAEQIMYAAAVPASGVSVDELSGSALRQFMATNMPLYCVPERVLVLQDLPRTGSGKTDRVELRRRIAAGRPRERGAPDASVGAVARIRSFILEELSSHPDAQLELDTDLLGTGTIESMGVVRLVEFLERTFDVRVSNDAFAVDNFQTLGAIVKLLEQLTGSQLSPAVTAHEPGSNTGTASRAAASQ
jgi:acyl-CoA synthetase (AMP-forming)/AMP-acid ligase II/acyl carrier protein